MLEISRMVRIGGRKWPIGLRPPKAARNRKKYLLTFFPKKISGAEILVVVKDIYDKAL